MEPTKCWRCAKPISESPVKIGFRATCPHCNCDLHVCKNCRYYATGEPNDCLVPGTEPIRDREASNFCEEFKPFIQTLPAAKQKDFHSLFRDD